jgi:hypothetical protein
MKYNKSSRRMFLQGAGNFMLAIPFLPSLLPREAWGQTMVANKRFITIASDLDLGHNANWIPSLTPNNYRSIPQPSMVDSRGFRYQALRDFVPTPTTPLARLYGTSLNNYLQSLNIIRGLDVGGYHGHGMSPKLGSYKVAGNQPNTPHIGSSLGPRPASIDYILSQNARINPSRSRPVGIGPYTSSGQWPAEGVGFTVNDVGGGLDFTNSFADLYRLLFTNVVESGAGSTTVSIPPHPRRNLLNRVIEDYNRTRSNRNLSSVDRQALTSVMDRFSDVLRRIPAGGTSTSPTSSCQHSSLRSATGDISPGSYSSTLNAGEDPVKSRILVDMITAAIMCNVNNIYTLFFDIPFRKGVENRPGFFTPSEVPVANDAANYHQAVSHTPWGLTRTGDYRWMWAANHQGQLVQNILAPLIANLSGVVDPTNNQTFLYNSLIFMTAEHGTVHSPRSIPTILAGNAGGSISSGNYIDYSDRSYLPRLNPSVDAMNPNSQFFMGNYQGVSYNRFLVTVMQAMGLQPSEYENRSLNQRWYNRSDLGTRNTNLSNIGGYGYFAPSPGEVGSGELNFEDLMGVDLRLFGTRLPFP